MVTLKISLSLNCQLKSDQAERAVGLPLVWVEMSLVRWQRGYKRLRTAWTVAGIGLAAVRYGVSG